MVGKCTAVKVKRGCEIQHFSLSLSRPHRITTDCSDTHWALKLSYAQADTSGSLVKLQRPEVPRGPNLFFSFFFLRLTVDVVICATQALVGDDKFHQTGIARMWELWRSTTSRSARIVKTEPVERASHQYKLLDKQWWTCALSLLSIFSHFFKTSFFLFTTLFQDECMNSIWCR